MKKTFWDLSVLNQQPPSNEELESLITQSIEARLLADVPVGALLSGGVDSALVAAVSRVENTWTAGGLSENEFTRANSNSSFLGTNHRNHVVGTNDFQSRHLEMVKKRHEPLAVPNEVFLDSLSQLISTNTRVVLSGEGADELFSGYSRIFDWAARVKKLDLVEFAHLYCYSEEPDIEVVEETLRPFLSFEDPYLIVSAFFQVGHLSVLLRRLDFSSMNHGLEARVPFTDYRLVERMFGLPHAWKAAGAVPKAPLRRVASKFLPETAAFAEKVGFPVNLREFLGLDPSISNTQAYEAWLDKNLLLMGVQDWRDL